MKTICTFLFLCIAVSINAQSIYTSVISNSGGVDSNALHTLNFTIGEPFIGTISNSQSVDQGFWFSYASQNSLSIDEFILDEEAVTIYPNPASDFLIIKLLEVDSYNIALFDMNGLKVLEQKVNATAQGDSIDINLLAEGIYVLSIFIPKTNENKLLKIIKK